MPKPTPISTEAPERKFDAGEDILQYFDPATLDHPNLIHKTEVNKADGDNITAEETTPHDHKMALPEKDWEMFVAVLANPPEPNATLKKAFEDYQQRRATT